MHVEDGGEVEPALAGRDVGQVGEPYLIGSCRLEVTGEPVGRDGIAVTAVGRPGATRQRSQPPQAGAAHQPLHAGSTDPTSMPAQGGVDAGRAVATAALGMDQPDVLGQGAIGD